MANLTAPVYMPSPSEDRIIEFKGLNRLPVTDEGEMAEMKNLTSDMYPQLAPRPPRGEYTLPEGVKLPFRIISKYERLAMLATDTDGNVGFWFDGERVEQVTGLSENSDMVAINTKICFFPDKKYIELISEGGNIRIGDFGSLTAEYNAVSLAVTISGEDVRLTLADGHGFAYDDAINIRGTLSYTSGEQQTAACNVSCVIQSVEGNTIILPAETFLELTGASPTAITLTGVIERTAPDIEHVIEWNNRLWGVSNDDNTIYACKLGDPKNWQYYQGTSMDSYYAQQGSDGIWTGSAPASNHIIFFKQNSMTRIYGSSPATFQVVNTECFGLEEGSSRSVAVINGSIFYKSKIGIMAYDGGLPYCISEKWNLQTKNVVAGTEGRKYYASVQEKTDAYRLLVYDTARGLWHIEDSTRYHDCCTVDTRLYYISYDKDPQTCDEDIFSDDWLVVGDGMPSDASVGIVNPKNAAERYEDIEWSAVFGPFDEYGASNSIFGMRVHENKKIYSKIFLRLINLSEQNRYNETAAPYSISTADEDKDPEVSVYISLNEEPWELVQKFKPAKSGGDYIPIIPRRCDRYSVKVEGRGNIIMTSLTRRIRLGTWGRL